VNCAGVYPRRPILEITDADWDFDLGVNVRGTYNMMAAAVARMRTQEIHATVRGRIVNVSSVDAFKAHPANAHYAATKAAVVSLTRSFALEFAPEQILVNSIAPAGIATDKAKGSGFLPELASHTPLGRNAEPDDIAEWIAFMLGNGNRYMTGENVIVSGGYIFA
jgi:3-oxoacyl-[acyl-carrier protein] reductase